VPPAGAAAAGGVSVRAGPTTGAAIAGDAGARRAAIAASEIAIFIPKRSRLDRFVT
jgi:hypothetical protein